VTTIDFPKRDGAPEGDQQTGAGTPEPSITLAELREQTRALAGELPGTLRRITLRAGTLSVDVEWEGAPAPYPPAPYAPIPYAPFPAAAQPAAQPATDTQPAATPAQPAATPAAPAPAASSTVIAVTAPLVGTFYRAPTPTAEPFVKIGDLVEPGQPLAIIEAMKLLNNITSEHKAKVVAIHVDNGDIVEYGQPLLDLEPVD
jgi:acetyl-CoA carboxylase biotin carboxyl carrier protein